MDMRRLEVFCKVVECRSFTRAADAVSLSQPSVSEHVRALEENLEIKLLDRLGREVLPTGAGRILYRYGKRILHLREEALQTIDQFRGTLSGSLLLGASTIPGAYILPPVIEAFRRSHPDIRIPLKIAGTSRIIEEILEGMLELALVGAHPRDPRIETEEVFSDELILTVYPDHPWAKRSLVEVEDLVGEEFIFREPGSGTRSVTAEALEKKGLDMAELQVVAEMGSSEAVRQSIKARLGISILSSLAVAEDVSRGSLVTIPLDGLRILRPFYLARRKGRNLSPLAAAFLERLGARSEE